MAAERDRDEDSSSFTSFMLILIHTIQSLLESENEMYPFAIVNCFKTKEYIEIRLSEIPWTVVSQAPLSMGIFQARISFSRGFSSPRGWIYLSLTGRFFTMEPPGKPVRIINGVI